MVRRRQPDHDEGMKRIKAVGLALTLLLAACATVPDNTDGEALDCSACRAIWIRLLPSSGAPGVYRAKHCPKQRLCPECTRIVARYFRGGELPARCHACGGDLVWHPVSVTQ